MSDAVNVLCHVEPLSAPPGRKGKPSAVAAKKAATLGLPGEHDDDGGAVWDIWAAEDAPAIVALLHRYAAEAELPKPAHPIHDGNFYVNDVLRERLRAEGVRGWRFVQRVGDAVFIPAGCPHQVLNLRSSIKVAKDFISPEHLDACLQLTADFRGLPRGHQFKEDRLSTKSVVLHSVARAVSVLTTSRSSGEHGSTSPAPTSPSRKAGREGRPADGTPAKRSRVA